MRVLVAVSRDGAQDMDAAMTREKQIRDLMFQFMHMS